MQQAAEPGSVLLTQATFDLVTRHLVAEPLGGLQVKGKQEPVPAYRLERVRGIRTLMDAVTEKGLSPFTGRTEELDGLRRVWDLVRNGQGQVVFVVGEAGIGKSRLALEFHRSLAGERVTWLEGHGTAYGGHMPFLPLIDLLRQNFRIEEEDSEQDAIRKIEEGLSLLGEEAKERAPYVRFLLSLDPGNPLVASMDAQNRRRKMFDAIRFMTVQGSKMRPLVLLLEDLHWFDPDSQEFLKYIIDSLAALPVLLILTYRPGFANPFGERTFYHRISLRNLQEREALDLAKGIIGVDALPRPIESFILERAAGNPFYVEELTKTLEEREAFRKLEAAEVTQELDSLRIPASIQGVLLARVDRLPEEQKNALQIAAVIGREFAAQLLDRVTALGEKTSEALGDLVGLELIYQKQFYPELAYMFKHALTHEVVYESLLLSKRKAIHAKVGEAVEELYSGRVAPYVEMLAHHFERGGVWEKAVAYLVQAGLKARRSFALGTALTFFERAKEVLKRGAMSVPWKTRYELFMGAGQTFVEQGRYASAIDEFKAAEAAALEANDLPLRVQAFTWWANAARYGVDVTETIRALDDLEPLVADDPTSLLGLAITRNQCFLCLENLPEFLDTERRVAELLPRAAPSFYKSLGAFWLAHMARARGDSAQYEQAVGPLLPHLKESAPASLYLSGVFVYGIAVGEQGRYQQAINTLQSARTFGLEMGDRTSTTRVMNTIGWAFHEICQYDLAIRANEESLHHLPSLARPGDTSIFETECNTQVNLGENHLALGNYEKARQYLEAVRKQFKKPEYHWGRIKWSVRCLLALGELSMAEGNPARAQAYLDEVKAGGWLDGFPFRKYQIRAAWLQGNIHAAMGKPKEAEQALRSALERAEALGFPTPLWQTHRSLGDLYDGQGISIKAKASYGKAREVVQGIADGLTNEEFRRGFLESSTIREVFRLAEPE